ncbi:phage shock protein PspA [Thalassotalea agarivorans]|uniref:Phage shock protein A (PspA) family protein n=1 Tax=Thalassotalea agarivorans TaxID=349064 RepID=A0A1I0H525_THASX|nr:phage shock protein PspA [Thalassotalea agarivorans]SET78816.1 phage shock protein A (PspA) family protein [Thalassotalea agarivorans]
MGIFSRFTDIVNANLNSLLDKAEHPEKMIRMIIQEMEETLVEVRATAAKQIAEKKHVQRQLRQLATSVSNWQDKAELAIAKGREDLARSALTQKLKAQEEHDELQNVLTEIDKMLDAIQEDSSKLQAKLTEAKRRQEALLMRQQSAEVRLKAREKAVVYNIDEAIGKFERYQQKIDRIEAEVEAFDVTAENDLESQFKALEQDEKLAEELAALKAKTANKKANAKE